MRTAPAVGSFVALAEDVSLGGDLAVRAALAVDNARLYRDREEVIGIVSQIFRMSSCRMARVMASTALNGSSTPFT